MKQIDFLPEIYRQQRVESAARRWWGLVAAVFASAVMLSASAQWFMRRSIYQELAHVAPKHTEALRRNAEFAQVEHEIAAAEEVAGLQTYLAHPWPRTQLLAAVVSQLPPSVSLTELVIEEESLGDAAPPTAVVANRASPDKGQQASPAAKDLAQLRSECDVRQSIISLGGSAENVAELHLFVERLGKSPLFSAAHLKDLETATVGTSAGHARFHVRVVVTPGYGQPGGPKSDTRGPRPESTPLTTRHWPLAPRSSPPVQGRAL